MGSSRVAAVVITFHPGADVVENLVALHPEVDHTIVVDNGSSTAELALLRDGTSGLAIDWMENGENLGIATALNVGIKRAQELGSEWVLLFDQDSQVTPGFRQTMVEAFERAESTQAGSSHAGRPGLLIPRYIDKRLGTPMDAMREADGQIETAMTSGTLVRMTTLLEHGLFVEELFIDGVDHEFSLRLRAAGLRLEECSGAVLLHSPGTPASHRLPLRRKPVCCSNYGPTRRYYQERNKVWLFRRYWRAFPAFCLRQIRVTVKDFIKIALFEREKRRKFQFGLMGFWHGVTGRMGRL